MGFADDALTCDQFLGGRLILLQPRRGYRAGVDPVFLAACVEAQPGQSVLDLGCGAGAAALCLGRRVAGLRLTGVERQADYADLARRNAALNKIDLMVHTADLTALPDDVKAAGFDHVIMNPPYHIGDTRSPATDKGREAALAENTPLPSWIDTATRRLANGGMLTLVQKAERLPETLAALDRRVGNIVVRPLYSRAGRPAILVLVQAHKGGRGAYRLLPPLILHKGAGHNGDGESYRPEVNAILRDGVPLPMA